MKLTPVKNTFIFKFLDTINNKGQFNKSTTDAGIILKSSFDDSAKESRWCVITEAGRECSDVGVGDTVLLPALRWTSGLKFEDSTIWKSDEQQVVIKQDKLDGNLIPLRDTVIFKMIEDEETLSASGIVLIKDPDDNSPRGVVVNIGPDCIDANVGDIVYYDAANFFDTFTHGDETLAFIKENQILALG